MINERLEELVRLISRKEDVSKKYIDQLSRLLRPNDITDTNDHSVAIRNRLRRAIQQRYQNAGGDGLKAVASFDDSCDELKARNSRLLSNFLALYEPLAFKTCEHMTAPANSYFRVRSSTNKASGETDKFNPNMGTNKDRNFVPHTSEKVAYDKSFPLSSHVLTSDDVEASSIKADLVWISPDTEVKLLKDLIYIFQGISGRHIRLDPRTESYIIDPSLKVCGAL